MVDRICDNCMSRVPADSEKCPQCGIRFENTNPGGALPNGWVLGGRYTVGRYMEIDGEGVTYSAIDGNTLQRVTIKEYMPVTLCATRDETGSIVPKPGNEVLFKTTRMDFRELYDTLLRMSLTEGLVQVLDVLEENNTAYAVIEKVEGPTLAEYLTKNSEPMEHARAMAILRPILMGVESMHAANLVHRGISPDNIILESGGVAKLGGFATLALRQQGSELKPKLYPGFSAPEQYSASEFEGRYTDIYALGAVLYRMLTGEAPSPADERKMQDDLRPARQLNKEIPAYLSTGIGRALRMIPAERLQTISDFRLALTGEGPKEKKGAMGLSKQQWLVAAIAGGAVLVILIVILLLNIFSGGKDDSTTTTTSDSSTDSSVSSGVENPVPDMMNQTRKYLENLYGNEYNLRFEEEYSESANEGYVFKQSPSAGEAYTGEIVLTISLGPDPTADAEIMPDFVASPRSEEDVLKALENMGVDVANNVKIVTESNNGDYEEGRVLRTNPEPGVSFNVKNDPIILYVAGEKPVTMPDLAKGDVDAAKAALDKLEIRYTVEWADNDGSYIPGEVAYTSVEAGKAVYPSSTTVVIYQASNVSVPNLIGKTETEAAAVLEELNRSRSGITVTWASVRNESSAPVGTVYDIEPGVGNQFGQGGGHVVLYVSVAEESGE